MTWAYVQDVSDASWSDYERVTEAMGDASPDGLIVHAAGPKGEGFRVIDVWESRAHYERFREEHLKPALERAGAQPPAEQPVLDELEIRNLVRGK